MFKLKTVAGIALAALLLLSGCSTDNPEEEIEPVNNTLPYDSRIVTTTVPEGWRQLTVAWGNNSSIAIPFPGEGATEVFGSTVSNVERVGLVTEAEGEVQYNIDVPYDENNIHFHFQVLAKDIGEGGEEPALVASSFGGCSNHFESYYYLMEDAYCGLGVSSSTRFEKQYRVVVFLDDNRALACDVSYSIEDITSIDPEFEDYADDIVSNIFTSYGLFDCVEALSGGSLPQGYLTLEDFRGMADTRLAQMEYAGEEYYEQSGQKNASMEE